MRRDLLEQWLSAVRRHVPEDVFARNWAAGTEVPLQDAIGLALKTYPADPHAPAQVPVAPGSGLTTRELEVRRLIARGQSNKEVAAELVLSVRTVERHITNLYGKIDARGKADATAYAIHHGLV